jgi:hypothetical protein
MRCQPFEHELSYVTDREDIVECNVCFIQWNVEPDTMFESKKFGLDKLYKLRRKYIKKTKVIQ